MNNRRKERNKRNITENQQQSISNRRTQTTTNSDGQFKGTRLWSVLHLLHPNPPPPLFYCSWNLAIVVAPGTRCETMSPGAIHTNHGEDCWPHKRCDAMLWWYDGLWTSFPPCFQKIGSGPWCSSKESLRFYWQRLRRLSAGVREPCGQSLVLVSSEWLDTRHCTQIWLAVWF